jgi:hypothetical protein
MALKTYNKGGKRISTIQVLIDKAEAGILDDKAKKAGFIIAITGELYIRTLRRNTTLYIEKINGQWQA